MYNQTNIHIQRYSLYDREENYGKRTLGDVLASFQLLLIDQADATPLPTSIVPPTKDAVVNVGIVGLRNLLPYALQPIQNSYVTRCCLLLF